MTVRELLERIDAHELAEWVAFFKIEKAFAESKRQQKPDANELSERIKMALKLKRDK